LAQTVKHGYSVLIEILPNKWVQK